MRDRAHLLRLAVRRKVQSKMPVHNADIAAAFEEIADLLEIEGSNPFRIRAYRDAARWRG